MGWTVDRIETRIGELEESTKEFTQKVAWRDKRLRKGRREGEREIDRTERMRIHM